LRNQGRDSGAGWLAHARMGYNYRISDINCALGIEQLKRIDTFIEKRAQVAGYYQQILCDEQRVIVPQESDGCRVSWFVFVIRLQDDFSASDRDQILQRLRERGVQCSNYFTPIHLQPYMTDRFGYKKGDFPITERVAERTIAMPFYNNLTYEEVDIVCKALKSALDSLSSK
ncbi:MAG: DegT/DnrJ/EryC1/StrS family aminotransferase, partial [Sedimentisphaerales bacterium]|nr:DegT/DnrJ/EryC1/StrS family aminotransferase [Sedimentisphaerales bacterium]